MAIRETISIDDALKVLNRMLRSDHEATMALMGSRVPCNDAVAVDPEIQVQGYNLPDGVMGLVGPLGLINGLFGGTDVQGFGAIVVIFDGDQIVRFERGCPKTRLFQERMN